MNKNIYYLFLCFFLCCSQSGMAQSFVTLDGSQVFSSFKFTDSGGNVDNGYATIPSGGYSLGYRIYKNGIFGRANVGMRKAGSSYSYNGNTITYNLQYCDIRLGIGYEYDKWRFKPYFALAPYYSFLLQGNQNLDGVNYDIKKNGAFASNDFGLLVIPGVKMFVSDYFSLYTEFTYLMGLQDIESSDQQTVKNKGYWFTLGIAATITKSKPKWLQGK